jgi:hypothetical protein
MKYSKTSYLLLLIGSLYISACSEQGRAITIQTFGLDKNSRIDPNIIQDKEVYFATVSPPIKDNVIQFSFYDYDLLTGCDSLFSAEIIISVSKVNLEKNDAGKSIEIPSHIAVDNTVHEGGAIGAIIKSAITMDSFKNATYKGVIRVILADGAVTPTGGVSNPIFALPMKKNRLIGDIPINYNHDTVASTGTAITMDFHLSAIYKTDGTISTFKITSKNEFAKKAMQGREIITLNDVEGNEDCLGDKGDSEIYMKPITQYVQ